MFANKTQKSSWILASSQTHLMSFSPLGSQLIATESFLAVSGILEFHCLVKAWALAAPSVMNTASQILNVARLLAYLGLCSNAFFRGLTTLSSIPILTFTPVWLSTRCISLYCLPHWKWILIYPQCLEWYLVCSWCQLFVEWMNEWISGNNKK